MVDRKQEFSKIYDEHIGRIYRFVYLKVSSRDTAEDLSSEVFLRFWKKFSNETVDNERAFLYGIARNVVADHYRKRHTSSVSLEEATPELVQDPHFVEAAALSSDMDQVRKALVGLNDDYQNLIIWRYLDELSISEIAQIEGKSEESVRVGLHRALHQLRGKLQ
jgi:RNA polymerase sigma-70 factor (ECF subfamily)